MKKIYYLLLILSINLYSQKYPIDIYKSYIADGEKYVTEGKKNTIPEKLDQGITAFKKAKKYAHLKSLGLQYEEDASNLIEKANKSKEIMVASKITTIAKTTKTDSRKNKNDNPLNPINNSNAELQLAYKSLADENEYVLNQYYTILDEAIPIYNDYALVLTQNNKLAEAKEIYTKILKYEPNNTDVNYKIFELDLKLNPNKSESFLENENDAKQLLNYLKFSLDDKNSGLDQKITQKILKTEDTPEIRDAVATIYFDKTGISHFNELFLSDISKINEYREYFIYTKFIQNPDNTNLESLQLFNVKSLEYYSNLVDLDMEYLKTKPFNLEVVKSQTSIHYNNLGWYSLLCQKYENTIDYFNESIKYGKKNEEENDTANGNLPHAYLFNNRFEEAKKLYIKLKDKPFKSFGSNDFKTFKDAFLDDFKSFREAGITNKDMSEIQALLEK